MKVLVIDDDKPVRQDWFADVFARFYPDWEVHVAWDADEALEAFKEHEFDLAFFDHDLGPGKNGSQIAYEMLNNPDIYTAPKCVWVHTNNSVGARNIVAHFHSAARGEPPREIPYHVEMFGYHFMRLLKNREEFEQYILRP